MRLKVKLEGKQFVLKELPDPQFYIDIINEPTPCDGCVHAVKCGSKRLGCDAFALYVNDGQVNWEIPRLPIRRTYSQIMRMGQGENSLMRRIRKQLREKATA